MKFRHSGILVQSLNRAVTQYQKLGFHQKGPIETLMVQKMVDPFGNVIELIQGEYHPHIAVNWVADKDGNWIEIVEEKG